MYVTSWSGQTSLSATGALNSVVMLTLSRPAGGLSTRALTLRAGQFIVEEKTTDYAEDGPISVFTGRRYFLAADVTFTANDLGPHTVAAVAEYPGVGFNNPLPGTISSPDQPGTGFNNDRASVRAGNIVDADNQPDVFVPDHVGQYIQFTGGANAGQIRQILQYVRPDLTTLPIRGGSVVVDGAPLVIETQAATWRILDWTADWKLTVTNPASPTGGAISMLDALGEEKNIRRTPGEPDAQYSERVNQLADVVTPNALQRAANRVLAPLGLKCRLREVGSRDLPGFYYDGDPASALREEAFAYDMASTHFGGNDPDRYKTLFNNVEFRAFFLIGVPRLSLGEFGFAYDSGPHNAYDTIGQALGAFYDGYALGTARLYRQIWQAVDKVRAGGVGFDLVVDPSL